MTRKAIRLPKPSSRAVRNALREADEMMERLRTMSREADIGGGEPFTSRDELDEAAWTVLCCQDGDDDLMCVNCQPILRRILATARLAVSPSEAQATESTSGASGRSET